MKKRLITEEEKLNSELNKNIVLGLHKQNYELKAKLKAKDEEELEFLQNILTLKKFPDERLIRTEIVYRIQKIKQRIKEE